MSKYGWMEGRNLVIERRSSGGDAHRAEAFAAELVRLATLLRMARQLDKIPRGTKPGDIPIEQPTTLELVINRKTAKVLGIAIPESLKARDPEFIE